jgi:hypothetical protein
MAHASLIERGQDRLPRFCRNMISWELQQLHLATTDLCVYI